MISSRLFQIEEAGGASADNSLLVLYVLYIMGKFNSVSVLNRPFYRYGGHVELIRFKEYYGMPRGAWAHFVCIFKRFSGHFFLKFS